MKQVLPLTYNYQKALALIILRH